MSRQVDVASGCLCERKEFSRRILPLRSAKRLLERTPSIYYRLGYAVLLGIVHRMLPWRPATQALDSTVTFLTTTDCWTRRRARQPRPAQIPTSWALCWCIARRSGGIPGIVGGQLPRCRLRDSLRPITSGTASSSRHGQVQAIGVVPRCEASAALTATSRTQLWLVSGQGCQGLHLSRAQETPGRHGGPWSYLLPARRRGRVAALPRLPKGN